MVKLVSCLFSVFVDRVKMEPCLSDVETAFSLSSRLVTALSLLNNSSVQARVELSICT